jgi:hypothetical protein
MDDSYRAIFEKWVIIEDYALETDDGSILFIDGAAAGRIAWASWKAALRLSHAHLISRLRAAQHSAMGRLEIGEAQSIGRLIAELEFAVQRLP